MMLVRVIRPISALRAVITDPLSARHVHMQVWDQQELAVQGLNHCGGVIPPLKSHRGKEGPGGFGLLLMSPSRL